MPDVSEMAGRLVKDASTPGSPWRRSMAIVCPCASHIGMTPGGMPAHRALLSSVSESAPTTISSPRSQPYSNAACCLPPTMIDRLRTPDSCGSLSKIRPTYSLSTCTMVHSPLLIQPILCCSLRNEDLALASWVLYTGHLAM